LDWTICSWMACLAKTSGVWTGSESITGDDFRMNTGSGRYSAAYNMVALLCFNEELSLLQRIQQRQSYKLWVHGVNPQSPLKV
jgi:hypothetical protein